LLNWGRGMLSTSPSMTETVGLFSNSFRRCETSLGSFSTASTRPASSSRRWVMVPYPAPGSRTVSVRVSSAVDTTLEAMCLLARRSEEHTSELQSRENLVCRLLLEKKKKKQLLNTNIDDK